MSQTYKLNALRILAGFVVCLLSALLSAGANADEIPGQFANISPLPGGGIAISPEGIPDGHGALQVNIPVAYTPRGGYIFAGGYFGGTTTDDDLLKNKSGIMGTSVGGYPRVYVSGMLTSHNAAVANAQVLFVREKENVPAVAAGVQSIFRTDDSPRWGYGVVTKSFTLGDRRIFASLGGRGNTGEWNVIGGVSIPIGDSFNLAGEYDGFQFNGALAWRPGGRYGQVTLLGGYNGHAGWLAGASIAVPFSSDY